MRPSKLFLFLLLLPLLHACHPKTDETASQKTTLTKTASKTKSDLACPEFSTLENVHCLCGASALALPVVQGWYCSDAGWRCAGVGGCRHDIGVCGFGGQLDKGLCLCGTHPTDETLLGDYRCQNGFWVCDQKAGCGDGKSAKAYGEDAFSAHAHCHGVKRSDDLAKYRCENKLWTCRHSDGCLCGDERIPFGSHCIDDQAFCDTNAQPLAGHYRCVGDCVPERTNAVYHWICQDVDGCPCGENVCGYGGSCYGNFCACGGEDPPEADIESYRCHTEWRLGIYGDSFESLGYWICDRDSACLCGDGQCAMGERCTPDGACIKRDPNRPKYFDDFVYSNAQWTCQNLEGCRCGDARCGIGQACIQGQCTCDKDSDCSQRLCQDGRCQERLHCAKVTAPKTPGYLCQDEAWVCRHEQGCFCGDAICSPGARCQDGQCFCGHGVDTSPKQSTTYRCENGTWVCDAELGCVCGQNYAPKGSRCQDGQVYCGQMLVKSGERKRCTLLEGQGQLHKFDKILSKKTQAPQKLEAQHKVHPSAAPDGDFCLDDKRPPKGNYRCIIVDDGRGAQQRSGWRCQEAEGCICGQDEQADICRSSCTKEDGHGDCLAYTWFGQYLPICDGPLGIGNDDSCVDACAKRCNGFDQPQSPGYDCDQRAWRCRDEHCVCAQKLCPKNHYCIDDRHCVP